MPFVVKGEGPFADYVRKALEYAQQHGIDLSGVEVEVVPDTSIVGAGAYTEHLGGLRFRIRYNPRYANDPVLASHEAGHVAKWTWDYKKRGGVQYVPDIDELLAEALGAVTARQLYGRYVTFKGAPMNLTQVLPKQTTYITTIVDGKPITIKLPEWFDNMNRYRAGILVSPYFYNVTNWAHVFGNFTAMPGDVIETIHNAWKSGAVEVVPGWGAVWRTTPTWTWTDNTTNTSTQQKPSDNAPTKPDTTTTTPVNTQKTDTSTVTVPKVADTTTMQSNGDQQKTTVTILPTGTAPPLSPSTVQPPKYFNEDIVPQYRSTPSEWAKYIDGRRVLIVYRNWERLQPDGSVRREDIAIGGTILLNDKNNPEDAKIIWDRKVPAVAFNDPNAWIEIVDEKTGKVLARLKSNELYDVVTGARSFINLFWAHVAEEEKWPGWERFVDRAKELSEKLGTWRPSGVVVPPPGTRQPSAGGVANVSPDGAVRVANAPTEYVPPKVPDDVRKQFESLLSELKKLGEGVNLKNVGEVHDKFIQLRDKALDIARAYPQLIDEANNVVGRVGSAIRDASDRLYEALAKAAGRDSFWKGEGDVKTPIGVYKYDPATGAFLLSLYDRPMAENIVGYIKDDGTPIVVKKTANMSEALDEYNKLTQKKPQTAGASPTVQSQTTTVTQSSQQVDFVLQPLRGAVDFLTNALKTGAGVVLTALGGGKPAPVKETSGSEFVQPPSGQQKTDEFVARPSRAPDYVLAEESIRRSASAVAYNSALDAVVQTSSGYRPADYVVSQQSSDRDYTKGRGLSAPSIVSPPVVQLAETPQTQESEPKRYRGRPVAVPI